MKKNVLVSLLIALALSSSAFATDNVDGAAAGGTAESYALGDVTLVSGGVVSSAESLAISPDGLTASAGSAQGGATYVAGGFGASAGGANVDVASLSVAGNSGAGTIAGGQQEAGALSLYGATATQTLGSANTISAGPNALSVSQANSGSLSTDLGALANSLSAGGNIATSYVVN